MVKFWKNLNPTHKRWTIVATVGSLIFISLYYAVKDDSPQTLPRANNNQSQLKILATNKLDDFTLASLSNTIDSLKKQIAQQQEQQKQLQQQLKTLQNQKSTPADPKSPAQPQVTADKPTTNNTNETFDNRQHLLELLAGLQPDAQKLVYYKYIQNHPDRRDKDLEKLMGYDFFTYHPPINAQTTNSTKTTTNQNHVDSSKADPLKSFTQDTTYQNLPQDLPQPPESLPATDNSSSTANSQIQPANTTWQNQVLYGNPPANYVNSDQTISQANPSLNQQLSKLDTDSEPLTINSITSSVILPHKSLDIPMGSLFTGVMITGLDAPTNDGAKADPYPVLVKLRKLDFLPNNFATDLDACFVLLSSYGDISSSRALMRTQSLSCITKDKYILEGALKGYVVGSDGKIGVEGRLVSKQGSLILKTISVSMLQSLAGILNKPDIILGSNDKNVDVANVLKQSGFNGAGQALNKVASFYLALANKMFPLIEVQAGTKIDIVLTAPVTLQLTNRKVSTQPLLELRPPQLANPQVKPATNR